ncbi:hypothetical protein BJV78DRAFT_105369 [Lactifluus subvellereus]|nr:hypothetical protein BJV78DRAFT_105369 [Lactifluus subvellereus]
MTTLRGINGTVCNIQQYQQSTSSPTDPNHYLSNGQSIGLVLTAEASLLSFVCVMVTFILIGRNVLRYRKALPNGDWKLLRVPADTFMFSLFVFDIVQALGGILNVRWAHNGIVTTGSYCKAQGIIKQIGELGAALITLIITVHTFITALWQVQLMGQRFAFGLVGLICVFTALWVGIGNGIHKNYEVPTPFWCWINPVYEGERLAGEYIWLWTSLFTSVIMYIPLYLWAEGRLSVDKQKWYKFHLNNSDDRIEYTERRAAMGILFYPLAYTLIVLPISVARWFQFSRRKIPSAAMFFGLSTFNLSGAVNVFLFLIIRPRLLLFSPPQETVEPE